MRILHTSDWHFGKKLEGMKRIEEQEKFINNLKDIVQGEEPDLILIAGDIFDTPNPSAEAETLFFESLKKISLNGKVGIIIIPGNHDNGERLAAVKSLVKDIGVIIYKRPYEIKKLGKYGNMEILESYEGGILLNIKKEKIFLYSLPYPSETALNETFEEGKYSERIGEILREGIKNNKTNIPTVIMGHLFVTKEDKDIELGGSMAVKVRDLPDVDYIALGHIHKPMKFNSKRACYSGSPIEYRSTENSFLKKVFIVDIKGNLNTNIKEIILENYKPIREYISNSIEEAIEVSEKLKFRDEWIYLTIKTNTHLKSSEIRKIKENKNIVEIIPILLGEKSYNEEIDYSEINIKEAFLEFYKSKDGISPSKEVLNLFEKLVGDDK
ncbi:exonuclease SbcCD subunit D [Fusobacterium sp. MFO224]|uniref:metallophosphoesterase family protein n=1 Tax=Fusobacterium sp. MFO224 TaxID=3378070 RepID=UPI003851D03C